MPVETYNDAALSRRQASRRGRAEYVQMSIIFRAVRMIPQQVQTLFGDAPQVWYCWIAQCW